MLIIKFIFLFLFLTTSLFSYQSEKYLKAVVIGKVAKYVQWSKTDSKEFIITVLHNPFGKILDSVYKNRTIHGKKVIISYIDSMSQMPKDTYILYISKEDSAHLINIIEKVKNRPILTISSIQGFAQKEGVLQINFIDRKIKFKINLDVAKRNNLYIKSTLLHISEVLQKDKS